MAAWEVATRASCNTGRWEQFFAKRGGKADGLAWPDFSSSPHHNNHSRAVPQAPQTNTQLHKRGELAV